jgi:predicted phage terminase large subunit-like protein
MAGDITITTPRYRHASQYKPHKKERELISPQEGPQTLFLKSSADIAILGGAAGGGKTFALLLEPLRHVNHKGFIATFFRKEITQIKNPGGLWSAALELYHSKLGAKYIQQPLRVEFASGVRMEFHHLHDDNAVYSWDGTEIPCIIFDELQHFTERQFFYLLTRNRSTCGIRPYVRGSCNPDPDSWLRRILIDAGFVDEITGDPVQAMSGKLRWFVRFNNVMTWGDSREELIVKFMSEGMNYEDIQPKSFTFIPATLEDNKILMRKDPGYKANLLANPRFEVERLYRGNWNARAQAGDLFKRSDFEIVDVLPSNIMRTVRYWDRAGSLPTEKNIDPDWTVGVKMGQMLDGRFILMDVERFRARPLEVKERIRNIATQEPDTKILLAQDPGQAGIAEVEDLVRFLAGFNVAKIPEVRVKYLRWKPLSSQVQAGNILMWKGKWNEAFILESEMVTDNPRDYKHDDQVDAAAGAFNEMVKFSTLSIPNTLDRRPMATREGISRYS